MAISKTFDKINRGMSRNHVWTIYWLFLGKFLQYLPCLDLVWVLPWPCLGHVIANSGPYVDHIRILSGFCVSCFWSMPGPPMGFTLVLWTMSYYIFVKIISCDMGDKGKYTRKTKWNSWTYYSDDSSIFFNQIIFLQHP